MLNLSLLAAGWAMTDPNFRSIVTKPDNVPITHADLLGRLLHLAGPVPRRAATTTASPAASRSLEKLEDEKVLVWPDLVYTELIAMIVATVVLVVWAIVLKAPLEQPATSAKAPNPSKAPWYFLGLQEMLVYFDPWMAGVVLPTMIIVGLMAMPYIDFNREGNGYYTFKQRPFAVTTFLFGFLVLWVTLIVLGTFLRGPNWNFFGPFEYWDTAQGRSAQQRQRLGHLLAERGSASRVEGDGHASIARAAGHLLVLALPARCCRRCWRGRSCASSSSRWASSASSCWSR